MITEEGFNSSETEAGEEKREATAKDEVQSAAKKAAVTSDLEPEPITQLETLESPQLPSPPGFGVSHPPPDMPTVSKLDEQLQEDTKQAKRPDTILRFLPSRPPVPLNIAGPPLPTNAVEKDREVSNQESAAIFATTTPQASTALPASSAASTMPPDIEASPGAIAVPGIGITGISSLADTAMEIPSATAIATSPHLVEASLVTESSFSILPPTAGGKILCFGVLAILVLVCGGIPLALILSSSSSKANPTASPTTQRPTTAPTAPAVLQPSVNPLLLGLPNYTLAALHNSTSPQSRAYDWLSRHPRIEDEDFPEARKLQLLALVTYYYAFNGDDWPVSEKNNYLNYSEWECGWGELKTSSDWTGNSCHGDGRVKRLALGGRDSTSEMKLQGTMPPEVALMTRLEQLHIGWTTLNASLADMIPTSLETLASLRTLFLSFNHLVGTLPSRIGQLSQLNRLNLHSNDITGTLLSEIALLTNLQVLRLSDCNKLAGTIPTELALLTQMSELSLFEDTLSGRIPTDLASMTHLQELALHDNDLTGVLPTELGLLTELTSLYLALNNLTGPIPTELGLLGSDKMEKLALHKNSLYGEIPTQLGLLTKLQILSLHNNNLYGKIPTQLGLLTELTYLSLVDNNLTGVLPTEVCSLSLNHSLISLLIECENVTCPYSFRASEC